MVRSTIAVIASYVAMFGLAFIAFTCAFLIVGPEVAFKPGIYEASTTWIGIAFVINIARCDYRRICLRLNSEEGKGAVSVGDPGGRPGTRGG